MSSLRPVGLAKAGKARSGGSGALLK